MAAGEVVAGVAGRAATGPDNAPVGQDELETEDVIRGDAVLEAVRAAGVLGDVAADGAGFLARWIGREEEPVAERHLGELEVDDPRLDQRGAVFAVDLEDAVHPRQAMMIPPCCGTAPPERPVPAPRATTGRPAWRARSTISATCCGCRRQGDGARGGGLDRAVDAAVVLVDEQVGRAREDRVPADDLPQLFDKRFAIHDGSHHSIFQARLSRREISQ